MAGWVFLICETYYHFWSVVTLYMLRRIHFKNTYFYRLFEFKNCTKNAHVHAAKTHCNHHHQPRLNLAPTQHPKLVSQLRRIPSTFATSTGLWLHLCAFFFQACQKDYQQLRLGEFSSKQLGIGYMGKKTPSISILRLRGLNHNYVWKELWTLCR